jgi:hypothetical protein
MESSSMLESSSTATPLARPRVNPRFRLYGVAAAWLLYAPILLAFSLSRNASMLLFLVGWAASLAWVLAGYRSVLGSSFTRTHVLVVGAGLSFGILMLASSGLVGLLAAFGLLPPITVGS